MHPCVYPERFVEFTTNFALAVGLSDVCTASGDIMVLGCNEYVAVAGGGDLTSVELMTDQTTALVLMTPLEGAVANLLAQSHPTSAMQSWVAPWTLRSGQKIKMNITAAGAAHTGSGKLLVRWAPISSGATLV